MTVKKINLSFLNSKNYSTEKIDGKSILVHCLLHKLEVIGNRQSTLSSKKQLRSCANIFLWELPAARWNILTLKVWIFQHKILQVILIKIYSHINSTNNFGRYRWFSVKKTYIYVNNSLCFYIYSDFYCTF